MRPRSGKGSTRRLTRTFEDFERDADRESLLHAFRLIATRYGRSLADVFSERRFAALARARAACWAHMRGRGYSLPEIGDMWGRHHTTILAAMRQEEKTLPKEEYANALDAEQVATTIEAVEKRFKDKIEALELRVQRLEGLLVKRMQEVLAAGPRAG